MGEIVRTFVNNTAKMKRDIVKQDKKDAIDKIKDRIIERNNKLRTYLSDNSNGRRFNPAYARFIHWYKEDLLVSLKQISFDPVGKTENWELKDKKLVAIINISREISNLGIEIIYINSVFYEYEGIKVSVGNNMYRTLEISDGFQQICRFLKLLTDYTKEIEREGKKKK